MPSKNKYWHRAWRWAAPGIAAHDSGLQMCVHSGRPLLVSVTRCEANEARRGVDAAEMPQRIAALRREGQRWMTDPRNQCAHAAADAAKT